MINSTLTQNTVVLLPHVISADCVIEEFKNYHGHNLERMDRIESMEECIEKAAKVEKAKFWTYEPRTKKCWAKTSKSGRRTHRTAMSGNVECQQIIEGEWFNVCSKYS